MATKDIIESRVSEISRLLEEGKGRAEIVQICSKKYNVKQAIIDRYIKRAKPILSQTRQKQKEIIESAQTQALVSVNIATLASTIEKRQILAKIMRGQCKIKDTKFHVVNGKVKKTSYWRVPNYQDILMALGKDNEMTGDFAPDKHLIATSSTIDTEPRITIIQDGQVISLKTKE